MDRFFVSILLSLVMSSCPLDAFQRARSVESDRTALLSLEDEWLHARDAATLERILAEDFVHPVPQGVFLSKAEHVDWFVKHLPPANRKARFDHMLVRIYGDTGVVNGMVVASDESGKEVGRTVFTDVFVYRDGLWQAVNAQENQAGGIALWVADGTTPQNAHRARRASTPVAPSRRRVVRIASRYNRKILYRQNRFLCDS